MRGQEAGFPGDVGPMLGKNESGGRLLLNSGARQGCLYEVAGSGRRGPITGAPPAGGLGGMCYGVWTSGRVSSSSSSATSDTVICSIGM